MKSDRECVQALRRLMSEMDADVNVRKLPLRRELFERWMRLMSQVVADASLLAESDMEHEVD